MDKNILVEPIYPPLPLPVNREYLIEYRPFTGFTTVWHGYCFKSKTFIMDPNPEETARVERDILAYLRTYPDAQDTLEGIAFWWLLHQKIKYQATMVRGALNNLVKSGVVVEVKTQGSQVRYKINDSATDKITGGMDENRDEAGS